MEASEVAADMKVVEFPDRPPPRQATPSVAFANGPHNVPDEDDPVMLATDPVEDRRRAGRGAFRSVAFADDLRTAPGPRARRGGPGRVRVAALGAAGGAHRRGQGPALEAHRDGRRAGGPGVRCSARAAPEPAEGLRGPPRAPQPEGAARGGAGHGQCGPGWLRPARVRGLARGRRCGRCHHQVGERGGGAIIGGSASRGGTVRKPRDTAALSERRAKRSEPASSAESGSLHWGSTMKTTTTANRLFRPSRIKSGIKNDSFEFKLRLLVKSNQFEVFSAIVVIVNTVFASLEVQYQSFQLGHDLGYRWYSTNSKDTWPGADTLFEVMDYWCGVMLTIEVLLKGVAYRLEFCQDSWNVIDLVVTVFWYTEVVGQSVIPLDTSVLRMGRMVRLFRLLKLAKRIHGFDSMYLMTTAIRGSLSSLAWSCCLLSLFQVVVALCVNSVLATWYFNKDYPVEEQRIVFEYWGSFSRALLTTFEMTLADFPEPCRMLSEFVNEWFAVFFVAHKLTIGFATVAGGLV
ncbi:unnamed protein product [Prorocentrum cordatum]|uniref:Ion transport domain-containing protein n=1 Tax=Prorocentrum cordatum TaxID=2364126 RepID=A0ABN9X1Q3_9DINO|nr:unnamed protein product [Polarella glacialis]